MERAAAQRTRPAHSKPPTGKLSPPKRITPQHTNSALQPYTKVKDFTVRGKSVRTLYKTDIASCAATCSKDGCDLFVHDRLKTNRFFAFAQCTFFKRSNGADWMWAASKGKDAYSTGAVPPNLTAIALETRITARAGAVRKQRWSIWRGRHGDATMTLLLQILGSRSTLQQYDIKQHTAWEFDPNNRYTGVNCEVVCPDSTLRPRFTTTGLVAAAAHQLVNPCPATRNLACKRLACKLLGGQSWAAKCLEWPAQANTLTQMAEADDGGGVWFVKRQTHGRGFADARTLKALLPRLPALATTIDAKGEEQVNPLILSRRVEPPLLLRGRKALGRYYVLVTSYRPLRAFTLPIYRVNIAAAAYSDNANTSSWGCMHDPQRHMKPECEELLKAENMSSRGLSWTGDIFERELTKQLINSGEAPSRAEESVRSLVKATKNAIVQTLVTTAGLVASEGLRCKTQRACFGLWGFDLIWDDALRPFFIEANETPLLIPGMLSKDDPNAEGLLVNGLNDSLAILGAEPLPRERYLEAFKARLRRRCDFGTKCDYTTIDALLALEDEVRHKRSLEVLYPTAERVREFGARLKGEPPVDDYAMWVEELLAESG